jgi:hypothetical protein
MWGVAARVGLVVIVIGAGGLLVAALLGVVGPTKASKSGLVWYGGGAVIWIGDGLFGQERSTFERWGRGLAGTFLLSALLVSMARWRWSTRTGNHDGDAPAAGPASDPDGTPSTTATK